jgi:hypothetical protein
MSCGTTYFSVSFIQKLIVVMAEMLAGGESQRQRKNQWRWVYEARRL